MMIIQDEHILKAESTMIGENNSIIKEDEINDLSITKMNNEIKSPNKRKQIKPNRLVNSIENLFVFFFLLIHRVTNEDEGIPTGKKIFLI
jgi:hypothetical protein